MYGVAATRGPNKLVVSTLIALTAVSGLTDAVSYLGFGHVFTANMTGNVVVLGFAAAGAPGFSAAGCVTSVGSFLLGAFAAGQAARIVHSRRSLLALSMGIEGAGTAAAAATIITAVAATGWVRFVVIGLLAFGMGMRNAAVRRLGLLDLTTSVLTMVLTRLAASSMLGTGDHRIRKVAEVLAMLAGATAGGYTFLHLGATPVLLGGSAIVLASCLIFWTARQSRLLDQPPV